ncbi:hypothetical protein EV702DRAFT_1047982 [Suillus placidus]|uniref:Uncharacterized protein n=1 Tax=Suillus placidus TaxID=48579 RepID=A0A9P6ZQ55_9AGAM|nr:hypothetical protein EV702DRAFT_1047982 [Suillus placidus]
MIPPSDLEKGQKKYNFRYPCCLCADSGGSEAYVETAVYSWWNETTKKSHWTARCASDTCGYQVKIDTYFKPMPWVAFQYPRRGPREQKIASVQFEWTLQEQKDLLNRLSLFADNGITEGEFRVLFKRKRGAKATKLSTVSFSNCHGVSHLKSEMEGLAHVLHIESSWISAPIWLNRIVEWLAHCIPDHAATIPLTNNLPPFGDELYLWWTVPSSFGDPGVPVASLNPRMPWCEAYPPRASLPFLPAVHFINSVQPLQLYMELKRSSIIAAPRYHYDTAVLIKVIWPEPDHHDGAQLFDASAARINILEISNSLGVGLLDAYITLIADDKLRTELTILSFLLKDRVYTSDLWEFIGERTIEAKQETILRHHQNLCPYGSNGERHMTLECLLVEERKKRSQMEVSLYSQAIEHLQQHWMSCSTAMQDKCKSWLKRRDAYPIPDADSSTETCSLLNSYTTPSEFGIAHGDKRTSVILNSIGPSLPMLSTWVTIDIQESFYGALRAEQACQAGLSSQPGHTWQRNIGLELIILQVKMCHAQAEINLNSIAIANANTNTCGSNFSNNACVPSSSSRFVPPPLPDEMCYYDDNIDNESDDFEDFEF